MPFSSPTASPPITIQVATDCALLHSAAVYLLNWHQSQLNVKEESLTDWLLFEIDQKSPNFYCKIFTRHEEARKTGADWEWWIVLPSFALRLRIQAKKIKQSGDHYKDIAHTNRHGLQIQKLISDAKAANAVPLYALFSTQASSSPGLCPQGSKGEGAFLASANRIFNSFIASGPVKVKGSDLLSIACPISCLLCCPLGGSPVNFIYHYFPEGLAEQLPGELPQGLHEKLPRAIASILEQKADRIPDWWEQEFAHDFSDVDAIVIYDARGAEGASSPRS